jgi:DNA transposition AAA+ family ATPase
MAYSSEERRRLLQVTLPQSNEVRAKLQEYLNRTGLTAPDFGKRISYSGIAVRFFLEGRYENIAANDTRLRAAISEFIDSHPVGDLQSREMGKVYETANLAAWRKIFYECLDKQRAAVVYGPPGIQKTFPVDGLIAELNGSEMVKGHKRRGYRVYCPEHCTPARIMKRIALACGTSPSGDSDRIMRNLRFELAGRKVLIVFDEAQHLDVRCLEAVRELLDELGWGVIFAGSHDLILTFKNQSNWSSGIRGCVMPSNCRA